MTTKVTSQVLDNTAIVPGNYGGLTQIPRITIDAQGRITSAANNAVSSISIASGQVTGLAASATTDTTNAGNIGSGTLPTGRLSGTYNIGISGTAATATLATKASTLSQGGGNGTAMTFNWSGQSGQPTWLWGGNDGVNHYVYNPSNFSVNFASSATNATNATNLTGGNLSANAGEIVSGAPTLWFRDTDQADFAVHVNSNLWYVLNESGSGIVYTDSSGNLTAVGNVTAYSDVKLKKNITTISNALQTVKTLRGVRFEKDGKNGIGVIAQEVQNVLPEVVQENQDGYMSVAYGNIVGVLIEAIKELSAEIEELKKNK